MKRFGFIKKPRTIDNTPFIRVYQVNKSLVNANVISFNITTNLTGGQTLNWDITGAGATEFTDNLGLANTVVLAANGNATVTKIVSTTPYAANGSVYGNTSFTFNLRPGGTTAGIVASNTAIIVSPVEVPPIVTGGTIANVTTTSNLQFTVHTVTSNSNISITNVGQRSVGSYALIYVMGVAGGGSGGGNVNSFATGAVGGGGGAGGYFENFQQAALGNANIIIGTGGRTGPGDWTNPAFFVQNGSNTTITASWSTVTPNILNTINGTVLQGGGHGRRFNGSVYSVGNGGSGGGGGGLATGVGLGNNGGGTLGQTAGGGGAGGPGAVLPAGPSGNDGGGLGVVWNAVNDGTLYAEGGNVAPTNVSDTFGAGGTGFGSTGAGPITTRSNGRNGVIKLAYRRYTAINRFISL